MNAATATLPPESAATDVLGSLDALDRKLQQLGAILSPAVTLEDMSREQHSSFCSLGADVVEECREITAVLTQAAFDARRSTAESSPTGDGSGASDDLTGYELDLVLAYRGLQSVWEQAAFLLLLKSVANGHLTEQTNSMSWQMFAAELDLPDSGVLS